VSVAGTVLAQTAGTQIQPTHGGASDVYVAILDATATALVYGSFFGGANDDRPKAIAPHPRGGFVIGGPTFSSQLPTTPNCLQSTHQGPNGYSDGFVCHVDPAASSPLRYSTYLGGAAGADNMLALAVETSGCVTVVGYTSGLSIATTPRCAWPLPGPSPRSGLVARLTLDGLGSGDLRYATYVPGNGSFVTLHGLALDDVGDVWFAGSTDGSGYPQLPPGPGPLGGRDGVLTHLPLLPGGVFRDGIAFQNPACSAPLYTGAGLAPVPGVTFTITATNAPPGMPGILVFGTAIPPVPLPPPLSGTLLTTLIVTPTVFADVLGAAQFPLAVPITAPSPANWGLAAQWFFFTSPTCPGAGILANSERLNF
jgi:hypothetical protein